MYVVITFLRLPTTCNSVYKNTVGSGRGNCMWVSYCIIQALFLVRMDLRSPLIVVLRVVSIEPSETNKLKVFDLASKH